MGRFAEGTATNRSGVSENNEIGSCEAHDISIRTEEDRSGTEGTVGKVEGGTEKGGVRYNTQREPAASVAGFSF
jgi:hypothetical protein